EREERRAGEAHRQRQQRQRDDGGVQQRRAACPGSLWETPRAETTPGMIPAARTATGLCICRMAYGSSQDPAGSGGCAP
ncbi:MAG: hypothetical protein R6U64_01170, partial [Bacteroidales bacterium]